MGLRGRPAGALPAPWLLSGSSVQPQIRQVSLNFGLQPEALSAPPGSPLSSPLLPQVAQQQEFACWASEVVREMRRYTHAWAHAEIDNDM